MKDNLQILHSYVMLICYDLRIPFRIMVLRTAEIA